MATLAQYTTDPLWPVFFMAVPIVIGLFASLIALGIAWGGRRVGICFGMLGIAGGLVGLVGLLFTARQLWWVAVIPLVVGAVTARMWFQHNGPVTARRLRFGLRGLLLIVLFVALMLGGATSAHRQTRIEKDVAAQIESLPGGSGNHVVRWSFGRVTQVACLRPLGLDDFEKTAAGLEQLSQLQSLQIDGQNLPGEVTQRIARLATLRSLSLQHLRVTDNDLRALTDLKRLEYLDLDASGLTDAGLVHLSSLNRLRVLHLYDANQITPTAMATLRAALPRLGDP